MKLGLALPHYDFSFPDGRPASFEAVAGYAERADRDGWHELWVSDHFWLELTRYGGPEGRKGTPECLTLLAALATRTSRARLGSLVLAAGFRPPALLAKMVATLDQVAGGRLDVGLGAGWHAEEFTENGLPFPPPGERLAVLEETIGVLRARLAEPPAAFAGRHVRVEAAPLLPGPVQRPGPPIWVGGRGDRLLELVARAADGWNLVWSVVPEQYEQRLEVLRAACAAADRPFEQVRRSVGLTTLIGRDADDLVARWRRLQAWQPGGALRGVELRQWAEGRLVGTADEVLAQLRGWQERGVEQLVCAFAAAPFALFEDGQLDLAAELVLPRMG
jgi:probable F420-dependent oxidoreductase